MATAASALIGTTALTPPPVAVAAADPPVRRINGPTLYLVGQDLTKLFKQFCSDRLLQEQKWIRNLRQYLGIYDPEIEATLPVGGSRAYPRLTRVKVISMVSRIMNFMFPGNEKNWELGASPSAEMNPLDVRDAVRKMFRDQQQSGPEAVQLTDQQVDAAINQMPDDAKIQMINEAVNKLARDRARELEKLIDDQLQEIGGDQTLDYVNLVRQVVFSGTRYGLGALEGPYLKTDTIVVWSPTQGGFEPQQRQVRKPLYEFLSVWDYYPDMSSKILRNGEGYFVRKVMGRSEVRKLADRPDFIPSQITKYLTANPSGNYKAKEFEQQLRVMGTKANVNDEKRDPHGKYEIIVWKGPLSADKLMQLGVDIPQDKQSDDIEAEIWMIDGNVIKAEMNAWRMMGCDVRTVHTFVFDEDDSSPIGNGLPNINRDSQMSICAAVRMALDNASVTCGPMLEMNVALLRPGQDQKQIGAFQTFERDDDGATAQFPAVREIKVDAHLDQLESLVEMFMRFMDTETFIGPATGGDIDKMPSEPARTAAGQSMMKGDAALPFKDVIRNFDSFTQSVILSLVYFNRKFNPQLFKEGDYDVIARGATSLVAKEVRGIQTDILTQTLTPEDRDWIDEEEFIRQRLASRDMQGMMLPKEEAMRNRAARMSSMDEQHQLELKQLEAEIRATLAGAFKDIAQGQKNAAIGDATTVNAAIDVLEHGVTGGNEASQAAD
jgi:hypothetical protein